MNDRELLKKIKETSFFIDGAWTSLSRISSFSVGRAGVAPTDDEILDEGIKRNCILLGLNPSDVLEIDWGNFHVRANTRSNNSYDHRIYHLLETFPILRGIYMTDLGKGRIDGDGSNFVKYFETHPEYRDKCFECLHAELNLFDKNDTLIICMHSQLPRLLGKYDKINKKHGYKIIRVTHYSYIQRGHGNDEKFYNFAEKSWGAAAEKVAELSNNKS